jgi:hypothetical protein
VGCYIKELREAKISDFGFRIANLRNCGFGKAESRGHRVRNQKSSDAMREDTNNGKATVRKK